METIDKLVYKYPLGGVLHFNSRSKQIVNIVLDISHMEYEVFIAKCRKREIIIARQIAHYLLRKHDNLSFSQIAILTGGFDHATVIHSCRKIKGYIDVNDELIIRLITDCEERIKKIKTLHFQMWIPIYKHSNLN